MTISGRAGHAVAVPLGFRKDAMHKASILINRSYELSCNNDFMLTVGRIITPIAMIFLPFFEKPSHVSEENVKYSGVEKAVHLLTKTLIVLGEK
ncbi:MULTISPECIES: hypothetical protein [unclassified Endozoicomonas]|uniref:hypothetical protein n=1 Tax=unclassified Endozoicomonas TaxID=2644528 RepID=UPI002148F0E9|nr:MULTISPECIES: hypothetical protein [unclassified Endozoicomonas]